MIKKERYRRNLPHIQPIGGIFFVTYHVHVIFQLYEKDLEGKVVYLDAILKSIKQFSASKCNKLLEKKGTFWQEESYDRLIRDADELYKVIEYTLDNPIKAGLCQNRSDWKWSYINEDYNEFV